MLRTWSPRKEPALKAKKKRKAHKPTSSNPTVVLDSPEEEVVAPEVSADQFVGQWNQLVSTTNWEKGRIICQWREALMTDGAAVTEYSDEAWSQLVGGVTSQHVGRLRRVFQRFGEECDQYEDLFWSHFQAALEWDDAEMWLEGAIRNDWSISQMRGKRWETLGTSPEQQQAESEADQLDVEIEDPATSAAADGNAEETITEPTKLSTVQPTATKDATSEESESSAEESTVSTETQSPTQASKRVRLQVDVEELPDDLADAFETFKLAIIAHRREGWSETTPAVIVKCLDALRELAEAEE